MKQGIDLILPVSINVDVEDVERIDFLFKLVRKEEAPEVKRVSYPGEVTYNEDRKLFMIPWSAEETYKVPARSTFFMDTKIYIAGSNTNPETPIVPLSMNDTLFERGGGK